MDLFISVLSVGGRHINEILRIGTRGSNLALTQAHWVADRLKEKHPDLQTEIVVIRTKGDIVQDVPLSRIGIQGVFVKEIEDALFRGEIDIAVHSMKDVPSVISDEFEIAAIPEREDPRDVFISRGDCKLEDLSKGARVGTGSLRRGVQIKNRIPDIEIVPIRGNVDTRIRKIETENLSGIILAAAGVKRMGRAAEISQYIDIDVMIPSGGQGAIGIELKKNDNKGKEIVCYLNHRETIIELSAERTFLKYFGGGCQIPIGVIARKEGENLSMKGMVASVDASVIIADEVNGNFRDWEDLGRTLAENILSQGGRTVLNDIYKCLS